MLNFQGRKRGTFLCRERLTHKQPPSPHYSTFTPDLGNLVSSHCTVVLKGHKPLSRSGIAGWRDGPISQTRRLRHREVK